MKRVTLFLAVLAVLAIIEAASAQGQTPPQTQTPPQQTQTQPQTNPPATVPASRIAVINTNAFYGPEDGLQQLVQQKKRVDDTFKDRAAQLDALEQRIASLTREIETQGPNLTPQARADKQESLERLQREFTRNKEDVEGDYQRALRDALNPVRERVGAFLENYAKSRGISIVLEVANLAQAGGLAYVDPLTDITRDFIAEYNRANPVATSSAPSTQPANQPATQPGAKPNETAKPPVTKKP
jgi:outer membrane protein